MLVLTTYKIFVESPAIVGWQYNNNNNNNNRGRLGSLRLITFLLLASRSPCASSGPRSPSGQTFPWDAEAFP